MKRVRIAPLVGSMLLVGGIGTTTLVLSELGSVRLHAAAAQQAAAAGARTVWDGVYTAEQSARGKEVATSTCDACHGEGLAGSDIGPGLRGEDFKSGWVGRTVGDLFEKIHTTMPANSPGSLKPQQSADLVAYIFKLNEFPEGTTELPSETAQLGAISISAKK